MPKEDIDYSETVFYKIVCKDVNIKDCYVGHTTSFIKRKCQHKHHCNNENGNKYNLNVYQFIRNNGGWENWDIIMIEKIKCDDGFDARKKERQFIEELNATLNKVIPTRTKEEYIIYNKEFINEYKKKNEKLIIKDVKKQQKLNYMKEYYIVKKDLINEYNKCFYEKNKEIINENKKKTFTCDCGSICRISDKARHEVSRKHIKYMDK
jgi:hypothetical protein